MKYGFLETTRIITHNNRVILANRETGQWTRISQQSFDAMNIGIQHNLTKEGLLAKLADDEDRQYISQLFDKMEFMRLIQYEGLPVEPVGRKVYFEITHRCNLNCIHCCIDAARHDGYDLLDKDAVTNVLDKLINWKPETIIISGGEPLVRTDIIEVLAYLADHYPGKVTLCTNGTLINEKNAPVLSKLIHQLDVSLDGVDEESCSLIRGPGVFNRAVSNIRLMQEHGMHKIVTSMALCDANRHLEEAFNELNNRLGTKPQVRAFSPVGRGKDNALKLMDQENEKIFLPDFTKWNGSQPLGACSCKAGTKLLFIDHKGDIYPCPALTELEFRIANINEIENLDVLQDHQNTSQAYEELRQLDPEKDDRCKDCSVQMFCWTCPDSYYRYRDDNEVFERRCQNLQPFLFDEIWNERSK